MSQTCELKSIPTLIVDTTVGVCVVKVKEAGFEQIMLNIIGNMVADGQARLVRLPSSTVVTGSIVDGEKP